MTSDRKSMMRNLGEFFGHIVKGVKTDPARVSDQSKDAGAGDTHVVRKTVEEAEAAEGVILRRTTIDEVEIRKDEDDNERSID